MTPSELDLRAAAERVRRVGTEGGVTSSSDFVIVADYVLASVAEDAEAKRLEILDSCNQCGNTGFLDGIGESCDCPAGKRADMRAAWMGKMHAELSTANARIAELEAALRPFAALLPACEKPYADGWPLYDAWSDSTIDADTATCGDVRRAATVLGAAINERTEGTR